MDGAERGVDVERQRQLMLATGYPDTRASGGFFSGAGPSVWRDAETDQRYLIEHGLHRIEEGPSILLRDRRAVATARPSQRRSRRGAWLQRSPTQSRRTATYATTACCAASRRKGWEEES